MTALLAQATPGATLLAAADADLDALADRLHDGVLQALVVARYACDAVARGADPVLARDAVQDALVALRRQVWLLRPRGEEPLPVALADLSAQLVAAGRPGLRLRLQDAPDVPPAWAAVAYRLVQDLAEDRLLEVRLDAAGLAVGAAPADPATWALRARAAGAVLHTDDASTSLRLPTEQDHP